MRCEGQWRRLLTVGTLGIAVAAGGLGYSRAAGAQVAPNRWNDARVQTLVALAIARRSQQLNDTALTDYRAMARGYLTFLAQVGPGFPDPPKAIRVDELAVEVYWHAPNLSKQRVIGRRDTLLLPADVGYYSDRFGIVQNNFPDSIRLGDGHDVRGVLHPLAAQAPDAYDYAIADSLAIAVSGRRIAVYEVRVRPRDTRSPAVVGSLYIERQTGALVRLSITFTRTAILDHRIETLTVTLDNALIDDRFWLPHRQAMEVARTGTWLNYPVRGIIRTRWEICCYAINLPLSPLAFGGPPIVFEPSPVLDRYRWSGRILDSLPSDVAVPTVEDVQRVEQTAHAIVRAAALSRVQRTAAAARGISDVIRVDRVEGLALGAGVTQAIDPAWSTSLRARYGLADREANGEASVGWHPWGSLGVRFLGYRQFRDVGDVAETSTLMNSLAAQEFGADNSDLYDVRGVGIDAEWHDLAGLRWDLRAGRETQRALAVHTVPVEGRYAATVPALALQATRASLTLDRPETAGPWGLTWRLHGELRGEWFTPADTAFSHPVSLGRAFVAVDGSRPFGRSAFLTHLSLGGVTADGPIPLQEEVYAGGPTTGPGYPFHAFVGRLTGDVRAEWQVPIPAPAIPLGQLGTAPPELTLAPFVTAVYVDRTAALRPLPAGWYPAVGVGSMVIFDLLRVNVARGLRAPGMWTVWVDITRLWWGVL